MAAAFLVSDRIARRARRRFAGNVTLRGISSPPLPIRSDDLPFIATTYPKLPSRQMPYIRQNSALTDGKSPPDGKSVAQGNQSGVRSAMSELPDGGLEASGQCADFGLRDKRPAGQRQAIHRTPGS